MTIKQIIFGGDSGGNDILSDLWSVDLSDSGNHYWELIEPKSTENPRPRYSHSACVIKNSLYIFGGFSGQYLDELWRFNFDTRMWQRYAVTQKV